MFYSLYLYISIEIDIDGILIIEYNERSVENVS